MKKIITILLVVCLSAVCAKAQDVIVLRDASEIEAKVITVGTEEITYKKWNFQDGPSYQIKKSDVFFIKYMNGSKDVFNEVPKNKENAASNVERQDTRDYGRFIHRKLFNAYVELGCPFVSYEAGPSLNVTAGFRMYDYGFVGLCFGMDALLYRHLHTFTNYSYSKIELDAAEFPIMLDLRGFYPIKENVCPFFEFAIGPNIMTDFGTTEYWTSFPLVSGRTRLMLGLEYKRLMVGLGYDCAFFGQGTRLDMGYAKIGFRFGKMK